MNISSHIILIHVNFIGSFFTIFTLGNKRKYYFECEENYYEFDENYYELDEKLL
jgi:hypothetical protein